MLVRLNLCVLLYPCLLSLVSHLVFFFAVNVHTHDAGSSPAIATDMPVYRAHSSTIAPTQVANQHWSCFLFLFLFVFFSFFPFFRCDYGGITQYDPYRHFISP